MSESINIIVAEMDSVKLKKEKKEKHNKKEKKEKRNKKEKKSKKDREKNNYSLNGRSELSAVSIDTDACVSIGKDGDEPPKKKSRAHMNTLLKGTDPLNHITTVVKMVRPMEDLTCCNKALPTHRYILAPMVGASELAFRILTRRYGCDCAYTPMISSDRFATDEEYRRIEFQTNSLDKPIVAHFSANNPSMMVQAAKHIEDEADAFDLNLGCPQRIAHAGHFGSYLLDECDRDLVLSIVQQMSIHIKKPMFVKIRLLDTIEDTIRLCKQLVKAGACLITIHGRYRVNLVGRTGAGARDGPAHLDQIARIKREITTIPIISNGNIITYDDVVNNLKDTGCDGVMSAEGILDNPALYAPRLLEEKKILSRKDSANAQDTTARDSTAYHSVPASQPLNTLTTSHLELLDQNCDYNYTDELIQNLKLGLEYLTLTKQYPTKLKSIIFHIRRMCKQELTSYQLLEECLAAQSIECIWDILQKCIDYKLHRNGMFFKYDAEKQQRMKLAAEKKKMEEGKRKAYEARLVRKGKREGLTGEALEKFIKVGCLVPAVEEVKQIRKMLGVGTCSANSTSDTVTLRKKAIELWKEADHSQHCFSFHCDENGCSRDRTCPFLHSEAVVVTRGQDEATGEVGILETDMTTGLNILMNGEAYG